MADGRTGSAPGGESLLFLTDEQLKFLKTVPGPVRPTLPVSKHENNIRIIGHGGSLGRVTQCLVKTRLEAALGGKLS